MACIINFLVKYLGFMFLVAIFFMIEPSRSKAEDCSGKLVPVNSLLFTDGQIYLKTKRSLYVLDGDCIKIASADRGEFKKLSFYIDNRFSSESPPETGYFLIKSVRNFKIETLPQKIKIRRGGIWYIPKRKDLEKWKKLKKLGPLPLKLSKEKWNKAHSESGNPYDFEGRIRRLWHSFHEKDGHLHSATFESFWKIPDEIELKNAIVSNYLINIIIRNKGKNKLIEMFNVHTDKYVDDVSISMISNIEALESWKLKFVFE